MAFSGSGAAKGATMGLIGGPAGVVVGGVVGGLMGGDSPSPWFDSGYFNDRRNQIEDFEKQLAASRARYLTSLGNMYNQAYARFTQNAEPGFANRGLAVNGGAFASALARKTADYQAELEPIAYQAEREDLTNVDNRYAALFGQKLNARMTGSNMAYMNDVQDDRAIGGFIGQLGMMGARAGLGAMSGGGSEAAMAGGGMMGSDMGVDGPYGNALGIQKPGPFYSWGRGR